MPRLWRARCRRIGARRSRPSRRRVLAAQDRGDDAPARGGGERRQQKIGRGPARRERAGLDERDPQLWCDEHVPARRRDHDAARGERVAVARGVHRERADAGRGCPGAHSRDRVPDATGRSRSPASPPATPRAPATARRYRPPTPPARRPAMQLPDRDRHRTEPTLRPDSIASSRVSIIAVASKRADASCSSALERG